MTEGEKTFDEIIAEANLPVTVTLAPRMRSGWSMRILPSGHRELKLPRIFETAPLSVKITVLEWAVLDRPRLRAKRSAYFKRKGELETVARDWLMSQSGRGGKRKLPTYETKGIRWDLAEVRDFVNAEYFGGRVETLVRWGRAGSKLSFQISKHLADGTEFNVVTIAGAYNHAEVPRFAIESIMHHEMLHIAIPPKRGGGRRVGRPERRLTKDCCMELASSSASGSLSAAKTLKPSMT